MASGGLLRHGERSGCLTTILVLSTLANGLYFVTGLLTIPGLLTGYGGHERLALVLVSTVASGATLACLIGIWKWKKWGLYGYAAMGVLGVAAQFLTMDFPGVVVRFIALLVVIIVMAPAMRQMR